MPYADPEKQREAKAISYRKQYAKSRDFREKEAQRKAAWLNTDEGKASNGAANARWRAKQKAKKVTGQPKFKAT